MDEKLSVAVLGLGRLGYYHTQNLRRAVTDAELTCVCDPIGDTAQKVATELRVQKWTKKPEDVFNDPDIDAVVIVTPTNTHAHLIKEAARNGKHIFVEKPVTSTLEEADEVMEVLNETNVICQVGFMRRYDSAYFNAKQRIEAGEIGKPIYFKGFTRDSGSPPAEFIKHSGGIFLDCSIHDYDIARYLMDAEITSVSAHGRILVNDFMEELNDVDQALTYLEFDNGAAGDVEASRNSPYGHDIRAEIIGTSGSLFVGGLRSERVTMLNSQGSNHEILPDFKARFHDAYCNELIDFITCIRENVAPRVSVFDSKMNMKVALQATKSSQREGEKLPVDMEIAHPFSG